MNTTNYQNMARPTPSSLGPQNIQQPGGKNVAQQIQQHVLRTIQQQQQITQGWQTTVNLQERVVFVCQLVTSLRLIKPDMNIQQSINLAINFEQKTLLESADRSSYEQTRRQKLSDIQETRSRQAATLQQQIQNPQSQQMNMMQQMQMQGIPPAQNQVQFHFNPNANPQLQQPMQVSGIPMQQQMMHPQAQLQMGNQTMGMHQPPQNLHPQMSQSQGQNTFTMEENQTIQRIAQSLAQSASPDQLNVIRHNLQNMNPEQRQALAMQGTDPVTFFFRNHAIKKFIEHRAKLSSQRAHPGMPTTGNGLAPQHSRPASQHVIPIQSQQQIMDSFAPSMDQIRGQQQDALRSQEAGQVVVPASSSQSIVEQRGGVRGTPQQQPNGQLGANRTMQNAGQGPQQPSQYWGNPQMQQSGIPQTPHMAVSQNQNFGNNAVQPPLQGQVGGLGNSMGRLPQQNPAMPNLNQGLNPPPQPQNMWGQPRAGQPGQSKEPSGGNTQQPIPPQGVASAEPPESGQQRLKMMMNELPLHMRQQLAGLPEEGRKEWLMNFYRRQQAQHQQRVAQQHTPKLPESTPVSLQNNQTGSQMQQPQNVSNQSVMNNPLGAQQAATTQQQPPPLANAARGQSMQVTRNQQIVQNRHAVNLANNTLTEEQARWMDQHNFPAAILNHGSALSQQLPQDIKTWGQLKSWVTQHDSSLPPGSLAKLRGLQGLHYQNLARHREQQIGQKPAPTAPMVNLQRHALPQPTSQEIQALRARLPDPLKGLSDDEVSAMVIKQRQQDLIKLSQPQQNMSQPQQNHLANVQRHYQPVTQQQLSTTSSHPNQAQQPPPGPRPQPHHTQRQQPSKEQTTKQSNTNRSATQTTNQGQSSSKGVKRNSNDDVVEVPNPNAANQDTLSRLSKVAQASTQSKAGSNPSEPTSSLVQDQKSINDAQRRVQPNQRSQASATQSGIHDSNDKGLSDTDRRIEESNKRDQRLRQLMKEISQNTPSRQPVAMNEQTRAKMVQRLRDAKEMVQRLVQSLPIFFRMSGDENTTRDLIRTRLMLAQQYRDADFNPIDRLTITPEELDECVKMLSKYFTFIMSQVVTQKNLATAQGQTVNQQSSQQAPTKSTASVQADTAPSLSTANLQEHQKLLQFARQASVQKSHNNHSGNRAPAAPTSPQPPFPLGGQSPQGVPTKYAHRANELTQDKLIFPPNKKRKSNQPPSAASTPVQTHTIVTTKSPSQANKVIHREAPRSKATTTMIKCPVADCQAKINGFSSQADLDNHVSEFHEPKEPPIEDPLQWALEQMRYGLGLDENGDPKPQQAEVKKEKDVPEATKMKKSGSSQDQITIKQESSTPMARIPTQTGTSKTPQALVDTKIAMSTVSSTSNNPKISNSKLIDSEGKNERSPSPDPWASSLVSREVITEVWSGLQDVHSLVSWGTVQSTLTPASTLSSNKSERNSPRVSDISENDAVKINLTVGDKDSKLDQSDQDWIPAQWLEEGLYGDMESLTVHNNMLGMDWETAFGKDDTEMAENGGPAKVGSATMDDSAPSAEFLRIYGREH